MPEGKGRTERYLTTVLMTDIVGSTEHAAEMGDSDFISSRVGNYQYHLYYGALLDQMWVQ